MYYLYQKDAFSETDRILCKSEDKDKLKQLAHELDNIRGYFASNHFYIETVIGVPDLLDIGKDVYFVMRVDLNYDTLAVENVELTGLMKPPVATYSEPVDELWGFVIAYGVGKTPSEAVEAARVSAEQTALECRASKILSGE